LSPVFRIQTRHLNAIFAHAEATYPNECCGVLVGFIERRDGELSKTLVDVLPMPNAWSAEASEAIAQFAPDVANPSATKARRYWIDPRDLFNVQREVRSRRQTAGNPPSLDIIGIYHSHPDHPAAPSECDRACAWAEYSYMIVSVSQGKAQNLLCWVLDDDHQFQPEGFIVAPAIAPITSSEEYLVPRLS
jgi:proteasome lid subunit RPN8/RPN11